MSFARFARGGAHALGLAGLIFGALALRMATASRAELGRAEVAASNGDRDAAIAGYRRAARLYAPGNPYPVAALEGLARVAAEAEADEDLEDALLAWRSARGAALESRSFFTPYGEQIERAEREIARLARDPRLVGSRPSARVSRESPEAQSIVWTLLALLGWLCWVGGAFAFGARGFDERGALAPDGAKRWGALIVAGFGLFAAALTFA